jgi:hypothetical protein
MGGATVRARARHILLACCFVVVAVAVAVVALLRRPGREHATRPAETFWARAVAEAPFGGQFTAQSAPQLADDHEEFRQWLAGVILSPDEDLSVRVWGVRVLIDMKNGPALYDMVQFLLVNLDAERSQTSEQAYARATVRNCLLTVALSADWPITQALEVIRTITHRWDVFLRAQTTAASPPMNLPPDRAERLRARAREILAYADSAVNTSAPPAAPAGTHLQPKPDQPPPPAE